MGCDISTLEAPRLDFCHHRRDPLKNLATQEPRISLPLCNKGLQLSSWLNVAPDATLVHLRALFCAAFVLIISPAAVMEHSGARILCTVFFLHTCKAQDLLFGLILIALCIAMPLRGVELQVPV